MFRDPKVVAAGWNDSEIVAPRPRADLNSDLANRSEEPTALVPELAEGPAGIEHLAQLPEESDSSDPFEDDEFFELFGEEDSEEMEEPVEDSDPEESSTDEYDLFDSPAEESDREESDAEDSDPMDLFEEESIGDDLEEDDGDSAEIQQPASQDLWESADDITPTPQTGTSELFEKMTDAEDDLLDRHDGTGPDPDSTDYLLDDSDDWLDLDLLQPGSEELTEQQRRILQEERAANEQSCQEEIDKLRAQRLENIDLSIRIDGNAGEDFPFECTPEQGTPEQRDWSQITYMWKASGLCHKPLYFEQVHLERHGHTWGPYTQPLLSGVHFFGTIPILPYKMGLKTPNECVYTLGHYRPGDCAPYMIDAVPFTWRAAGYQFGASTGLSFLVP